MANWSEPRDWVTGEVVSSTHMNTHVRDAFLSSNPIGEFKLLTANTSASENLINGAWLECNGVAVSRTTYADLFALLNGLSPALPYGTGDGSTTFNLPDLRGRVPIHQGTHTSIDAIGESDGVSDVQYRRPHHKHSYIIGGSNSPGSQVPFAQGTLGAGNPQWTSTGGSWVYNTYGLEIGPTGTHSVDAPAFLVVGVWAIKALP